MKTAKNKLSGFDLGAKLGPMLWKKLKKTGIINRFFPYFPWVIPFKAQSGSCATTQVETVET